MSATTVRFTLNNEEHTGTLIAKKGLFWEVETEPGITKKVPVKAILNKADFDLPAPGDTRMGPAAAPAAPGTLAAQLETLEKAQAERSPSKKAAAKKAEKDPNMLELADLCKEYGVLGRIARRRLRKVLGKLPQGERWAWSKDSEALTRVREILAAKEDPADPTDTPVIPDQEEGQEPAADPEDSDEE